MHVKVEVIEDGGMVLPMSMLKRLGLEEWGTIILEERDAGVVLRTVKQVVDTARVVCARYGDLPGGSVDAFLINR